MFTWSIKDVKTQIEAANKLKENVSITASRRDGDNVTDGREISFNAEYSYIKDEKEDIYPYWKITLKEEELTKTIYLGGNEVKEVKRIINGFYNQTKYSFIETLYNY